MKPKKTTKDQIKKVAEKVNELKYDSTKESMYDYVDRIATMKRNQRKP